MLRSEGIDSEMRSEQGSSLPSPEPPDFQRSALGRNLGLPTAGEAAPSLHRPLLSTFASLSGRIGILGGTFDPPHLGHLAVAHAAMAELRLDALVFIPARQNPLKSETPSAPAVDRLAMLTSLLESEPKFFVSPIEIKRTGVSYTIDTLKEIHAQLPPASSIFLLAGADILQSLHKWHSAEKIPELATLVVMPRGGYTQQDDHGLAHTALTAEHLPRVEISSTKLREALAAGEMPAEIPIPVQDYILEHRLYQND